MRSMVRKAHPAVVAILFLCTQMLVGTKQGSKSGTFRANHFYLDELIN